MSRKAWIVLLIIGVLICFAFVFGGALVGGIFTALSGGAVATARRKEKKHQQEKAKVQKAAAARVQQIELDIKHEAKVMRHLTNKELVDKALDDANEILGDGRR